jgi:hypothetical protein
VWVLVVFRLAASSPLSLLPSPGTIDASCAFRRHSPWHFVAIRHDPTPFHEVAMDPLSLLTVRFHLSHLRRRLWCAEFLYSRRCDLIRQVCFAASIVPAIRLCFVPVWSLQNLRLFEHVVSCASAPGVAVCADRRRRGGALVACGSRCHFGAQEGGPGAQAGESFPVARMEACLLCAAIGAAFLCLCELSARVISHCSDPLVRCASLPWQAKKEAPVSAARAAQSQTLRINSRQMQVSLFPP